MLYGIPVERAFYPRVSRIKRTLRFPPKHRKPRLFERKSEHRQANRNQHARRQHSEDEGEPSTFRVVSLPFTVSYCQTVLVLYPVPVVPGTATGTTLTSK